jgi:hypothetical protein
LAHNATFEVGGPDALSPLEVVSIFEDVSGRVFELTFVPERALSEQHAAGNDSWVRSLAGLQGCYADGDVVDMRELTRHFPLTLTAVRDYASRVLMQARATRR